MMRTVAVVVLSMAGVACGGEAEPVGSQPNTPPLDRTESLGESLSSQAHLLLGEGVREGPAVAARDVLSAPESFVGKALRVEGEIRAVDAESSVVYLGGPARVIRVEFAEGAEFAGLVAAVGRQLVVEGELGSNVGADDAGSFEVVVSLRAAGAALAR